MNFRQRFFDPHSLWMISPEHLVDLMRKATMDASAPAPFPLSDASDTGDDDADESAYEVENGVAIIEISGVIVRTAEEDECEYFGLCSLETVADAINQANADPAVTAILLSIDSPGGEACGTPELADLVGISSKPVCAWTPGLMASAAYFIGSQADLVFASKSAMVGSIGTIMTTYDWTGYMAKLGIKPNVFTDSPLKASGHPGVEMTTEQRSYLQSMVDEIGAAFRSAVVAQRGAVPSEAMQGQIFIGASAQSVKLITGISNREEAIQQLLKISA